MALTNQQYETIMRRYEQTRTDNRHLLTERTEEVYAKIPAYQELEASVSTNAMSKAKAMLAGDDTAVASMHDFAAKVQSQKKALLTQAGFPADYLEPIYTCPVCKDTGYVMNGSYREKCNCLRMQEIELLYIGSNLRDVISTDNFSTLSYDYYTGEALDRFTKTVNNSKDFVQNFEQDYKNILFYGTVGTGKSFLSGCIANELLRNGHSVLYFSSAGLFDLLAKYTFNTQNKEALYKLTEDLYNSDLVIIDDLGTELTNQFVATQLFSLLNERNLRRKSMIISSNLSLEELQERYSDRVFSRITSNFDLNLLTGPDIRMIKKIANNHTTE